MDDPLMDWLERNNPDMARFLDDERYFNSETIERLQAQVEQLRHALDFAWAVIANNALWAGDIGEEVVLLSDVRAALQHGKPAGEQGVGDE